MWTHSCESWLCLPSLSLNPWLPLPCSPASDASWFPWRRLSRAWNPVRHSVGSPATETRTLIVKILGIFIQFFHISWNKTKHVPKTMHLYSYLDVHELCPFLIKSDIFFFLTLRLLSRQRSFLCFVSATLWSQAKQQCPKLYAVLYNSEWDSEMLHKNKLKIIHFKNTSDQFTSLSSRAHEWKGSSEDAVEDRVH